MDDRDLIQSVLEHNDHKAFATLVDRYQRMVATTCLGLVGSPADADDLTQDVFLELYESLPSFRKEAKLSTWIYRIAVNKSINFMKRRKRHTLFTAMNPLGKGNGEFIINQAIASESVEADHKIRAKEQRAVLKASIARLPENQRIAFILSKYQELSYKEIAEVMGVTVSSVESLLFRAKANLQKDLAEYVKKMG
jgi:RNA polymerase sigma-70 factor (ECF subfamily)